MKQKIKTKTIIIILALLIIAVSSIGLWSVQRQTQASQSPPEKITVGVYAGDTAALVWIAEDQGFFSANGLEVTLKEYEAGALAAEALLADEVDIATAAEFVLVSHSFNEVDLRILGTVATAQINKVVARQDRQIQQPADLKGKRIGVTRKSTGEFFLGRFLLFNGLSLQDVDIIDLSPSEIVEAMANGSIDAALTWEPNIYEIKNRLGENVNSWPGQSNQDFYFILISQADWVKRHPLVIERFLHALIQAEEFAKNNNETARQFITQRFNYEPAYVQYVWPEQDFAVELPQALLLAMEDEARWRIENKLTDQATIPNYFNDIYFEGLEAVKPDAVTVIR